MSRHLRYSTINFIDENCELYANSEHTLYVLENLYNTRSSDVYRTTGIGEVGDPEWICVDLGTHSGVDHDPDLCCLFNHNLTQLVAAGDELNLLGCDDGCPGESGACFWFSGFTGCTVDLTTSPCADVTQPIANFLNLYRIFDCSPGHRFWALEMIDQNNEDGYLQVGEMWLGKVNRFHTGSPDPNWVHLQPGRADGPLFFMGNNITHYGQDWPTHYSDAERFTLTFKNVQDPCYVDELHAFLRDIMVTGGRFVLIPDDRMPFCYYVIVTNMGDFAQRLVYGTEKELREWKFELKTLTQGIKFLG